MKPCARVSDDLRGERNKKMRGVLPQNDLGLRQEVSPALLTCTNCQYARTHHSQTTLAQPLEAMSVAFELVGSSCVEPPT